MKPDYMRVIVMAGALALTGCDSGASAVAARDHSQSAVVETAPVDVKADPAPLVDGKPIWTSNARHTAQENAEYHFDRDGSAFGAKSPEDLSRKAYAFIEHPPKSAETLTRANGDRLIYDPATNTFAVATKDGQPRTLFKPDDGPAYWAKQKDRLKQAERGSRSNSGEG